MSVANPQPLSRTHQQFDIIKGKLGGEEGSATTPYTRRMTCLCPVHEGPGSTPSLSVDIKLVDGQEQLLWHCFGGCERGAVKDAVMKIIKGEESQPTKTATKKTKKKTTYTSKQLSQLKAENKAYTKTEGRWVYRFIDGRPLSEKIKKVTYLRGEDGAPDTLIHKTYTRLRCTNVRSETEYDLEPGLSGASAKPGGLYRLENLVIAQRKGAPVVIVEGEKDADTVLKKMGVVAVSGANGAGQWTIEDTDAVLGGHLSEDEVLGLEKPLGLLIMQDNDDPGRASGLRKALMIWERAQRKGIKIRLKLLPCFEVEGKKGADVSDWFEEGGTKEGLLDIIKSTPWFNPEDLDDPEPWLSIKSEMDGYEAKKDGQEETGGDRAVDICDKEFEWPNPKHNEDFSDKLFAEFLLRDYGHVLKYVDKVGHWLRYNPSSGIWEGEGKGSAVNCLWDLSRRMLKSAESMVVAFGDEEAAELRQKRIKASQYPSSWRNCVSIINSAETIQEFNIKPEMFDANPDYLPLLNGVVDLRSKELLAHRPEFLNSKQIKYRYHPEAKCPKFMQFMKETFISAESDKESKNYLEFGLRWMGYCFTGHVTEQVYSLIYGGGNNGKSVLVNLMLELAGEFGTTLRVENILKSQKQQGNEATPELAKLHGKRIVSAGETPSNAVFNDSLLNDLVSGDPISVRFLRQESFILRNKGKILVRGNNLPNFTASNKGMTRRLLTVPLINDVPEQKINRNLEKELMEEAEGVLAVVVEYAGVWRREGLNPPKVCLDFKASYQAEMDSIADFIEDLCEVGGGLEVERNELFKTYKMWCSNKNEEPLSKKAFAMEMRRKGFLKNNVQRKIRGLVVRVYSGIKIASDKLKGALEEFEENVFSGEAAVIIEELED